MAGRVLLGTQNWQYRDWVGHFYPPEVPPSRMLAFYGSVFHTVEVDSTFYGLPPEPLLQGWRRSVPGDFRFALKLPQQVTHDMRLVGTEEYLARFFDRVSVLGDSLGPLLIQLSPDFHPTGEQRANVQSFVQSLPNDYQWAIEFRHRDWTDEGMLKVLERAGVSLVLADGRWVRREHVFALARTATANFAYIRWMGSRDDPQATNAKLRAATLDAWAEVLSMLQTRVDVVYGYFNNLFGGPAPASALQLTRLLGKQAVDPRSLHEQRDLF